MHEWCYSDVVCTVHLLHFHFLLLGNELQYTVYACMYDIFITTATPKDDDITRTYVRAYVRRCTCRHALKPDLYQIDLRVTPGSCTMNAKG